MHTCTYIQLVCAAYIRPGYNILRGIGYYYDNNSISFNRLQTSTEVVYPALGSILQLTDAAMIKLRG